MIDLRFVLKEQLVVVSQIIDLVSHFRDDFGTWQELKDVCGHFGVHSLSTARHISDYGAYADDFSLPNVDVTAKSQLGK